MLVIKESPVPKQTSARAPQRPPQSHLHRYQRIENRHAAVERQLRHLRSRKLAIRIAEHSDGIVVIPGEGLREHAVVPRLLNRVRARALAVQVHRLRQNQAARLLQLRRGRDDELALLVLEAEAPVDVRVVAEFRDLLQRETVSFSWGRIGRYLGTYVAWAVGVLDAHEM